MRVGGVAWMRDLFLGGTQTYYTTLYINNKKKIRATHSKARHARKYHGIDGLIDWPGVEPYYTQTSQKKRL